jgi:hypothetical protein
MVSQSSGPPQNPCSIDDRQMDTASLLHSALWQGEEILNLSYLMLGVATIIFAELWSFVICAVRFRRRERGPSRSLHVAFPAA